jgi:hypothetical protein
MAVEATNTFSYWLPFITGSVGLGSGIVLEWLRDKRTYERERVARDDARRDKQVEQRNKQIEQRNDLQRQTLLDLQEALLKLMQSAGSAHSLNARVHTTSGAWNHNHYPEEFNDTLRLAQATSTLLVVRIRDRDVRNEADAVKIHCARVTGAKNRIESDSGMEQASKLFSSVNTRIGELIRELDANFEAN